ncbi:MAG: Holliday junction branch migration protein RuvA [Candidatus Spechtbacterales bacterium]
MIALLKGTIRETGKNSAVVEVGGVGYEIQCAARTADDLSKKTGQDIEVFTHYYLRENTAELYGFLEKEERNMFEILIKISGVGPRGALNILNAAPINMLQRAIAEGDTSILTRVSGIGNKIAQKIILELKDKFGTEWGALAGDIRGESDVVEALESLGYSRQQAQSVLKQIPEDLERTEDKVKEALKILGQK